MKIPSHRKINQILAGCVIAVGLYLLIVPLLPVASYKLKTTPQLASAENGGVAPKENRLILPSAKVDTEIVEGLDISVINNGNVWRRPATSNDPSVSNMVIVGHNYTYKDPTPPLYGLNEAGIGDEVFIFWHGQKYSYKIFSKEIVSPSAVEVEDPTEKPTLTLYTCYPLFIANQRLVIKAELLQ